MGKLILVSGENNSGKSVFAERLITKYNGKRYYIATMIPRTKDNYERIIKHKKQREGLDFITKEAPYNLLEAETEEDSVVLLEDVSNLLANNIFERKRSADDVFFDIMNVAKSCKALVAVTISGLEDNGYDDETARYIISLDEINKKLYDKASVAVTMKDGKPIYEKGESYDII